MEQIYGKAQEDLYDLAEDKVVGLKEELSFLYSRINKKDVFEAIKYLRGRVEKFSETEESTHLAYISDKLQEAIMEDNNLEEKDLLELKPVVLFHENCKDGLGAAYATYEKLGDTASYVPIAYGREDKALKKVPDDVDVYFVDFSLKREPMIELSERVSKIVVIDHHKSALEELVDLPDNVEVNFDMDHSGAVLAWDYFHDTPAPKMLQYIEDRDIWNFDLVKSKEFTEGLDFYAKNNDIAEFKRLIIDPASIDKMIDIGDILVPAMKKRLQECIDKIEKNKEKYIATLEGEEFIFFNYTVSSEKSDLGNMIASQFQIPAAIFTVGTENVSISLRSADNLADVSRIAIAFGSGGHRNASGMAISKEELNTILVEKKLVSSKGVQFDEYKCTLAKEWASVLVNGDPIEGSEKLDEWLKTLPEGGHWVFPDEEIIDNFKIDEVTGDPADVCNATYMVPIKPEVGIQSVLEQDDSKNKIENTKP